MYWNAEMKSEMSRVAAVKDESKSKQVKASQSKSKQALTALTAMTT
jgi:hypothetical protein